MGAPDGKVIALVGNPNCGKTTLFNALTGSQQYVGNWPGVTVEKKEGRMKEGGLRVMDLPGIYSLSPYTMEEIIARDYILDGGPDLLLNIVDGTNLERNLYLSLQLLELGLPTVIAVNMMDDVRAKGDQIDCGMLSQGLGVPVIPITARRGENLPALLSAVEDCLQRGRGPARRIRYDDATERAMGRMERMLNQQGVDFGGRNRFYLPKLLEDDGEIKDRLALSEEARRQMEQIVQDYEATSRYGDRETMVADARYRAITELCGEAVIKNQRPGAMTLSDKIDRIATSRIFALPVFLFLMFLMFSLTFGPVGRVLGEGVEALMAAVGNGVRTLLDAACASPWTYSLLLDAVVAGVGAVLSFLPQIMLLFFFLSLLEDSGYMARAAFIMDRLLRKLGLSGKSFIPMLMGFGCTTPAVMAARTMENEKERRMTIMLTPFMSCSARLPIYALFASIFFPRYTGLVIFAMYLTGMLVAILCGLLLKKTVLKEDNSTFVMELPPYRLPTLKSMGLHMWDKCKGFLIRAGTLIFLMTVLIWLLQHFDFHLRMVDDMSQSIFAVAGSTLAPVFAPLGFGFWQASVALLTGLVAKETVVSSFMLLYGCADKAALGGILATAFTPLSALSFLVFVLLYMPCVSAFASICREMNSFKWAGATVALQMGAAYLGSLLVFQVGSLLL
ncbi:ferrous iron transport protein B [Zongyangia hominis]|uniref:Ferrous iron transport protein B n=1 Tax=Zongyangia hominis TaxID=2763677 RepID=A0A926IAM0_9FIRM|nr:ferrous iron transport protein B [Zongyangia hominis]MBC8569237.1 ferrous iron transport protein B [Zongyangia hominis]